MTLVCASSPLTSLSFSGSNSGDLIITESLIRLFGELLVQLVKVNSPVKVWILGPLCWEFMGYVPAAGCAFETVTKHEIRQKSQDLHRNVSKMWISAFLPGVSSSSVQSIKCTKGDKSLPPLPPCSCGRELVRIHLVIHERNLHLPRLSKEEDLLAHVTGKSKGGLRFSHNCMPETLHLCQGSFFLPLLLSSSSLSVNFILRPSSMC